MGVGANAHYERGGRERGRTADTLSTRLFPLSALENHATSLSLLSLVCVYFVRTCATGDANIKKRK